MRESVKDKRNGKLVRGVLVQQCNAPFHTSKATIDAVKECGFGVLPPLPYSLELAPSDHHLFQELNQSTDITRGSIVPECRLGK